MSKTIESKLILKEGKAYLEYEEKKDEIAAIVSPIDIYGTGNGEETHVYLYAQARDYFAKAERDFYRVSENALDLSRPDTYIALESHIQLETGKKSKIYKLLKATKAEMEYGEIFITTTEETNNKKTKSLIINDWKESSNYYEKAF
ncbi:MAG: hypothetical protein OQK82_05905 [Candidatus Pacearchaeota archaeon]|nr:hypothetical protein [Candidatus Pacearchaeota archaeon]